MSTEKADGDQIHPILPQTGELYYEASNHLALCQPHLMPLKSLTLSTLEKLQKQADKDWKELKIQSEETKSNE